MRGKWHISPDGVARECQNPNNCKYKLSNAEHFDSYNEAQRHYEHQMIDDLVRPIRNSFDSKGDGSGSAQEEEEVKGPPFDPNYVTMTESRMIGDMATVEEDIELHKKAIKSGADPHKLVQFGIPKNHIAPFIDMKAFEAAWPKKDYDTIRQLYIDAYKRSYGTLDQEDYRMTDAQLKEEAIKEMKVQTSKPRNYF